MSNCDCHIEVKDQQQKSVLIILLVINGLMFVVEFIFGLYAQSTSLIADSLDMLADAAVYGIGLYAVGRASIHKIRAAYASGVLQILLGMLVVVDVLRRFIYGSEPEPGFLMGIGLVALVANVICLKLISKHRDGEVHMRASWIFSKNDVIANLGTIVAGILVYVVGSRLPDLVIGCLIALVVIKGGWSIIGEARAEKAS